jgi:MarR family transcriptional regulator, transcriptional regulator for hemolysin
MGPAVARNILRAMDIHDRVEFGFAVTDLARLLRRVYDRRTLHLGLTRAQWRAMYRIERVPGLSQTQLAEDLDLEPIAVGRVVDRLVRAGLVERREDGEDRRRWNLFPLERSAEVLGALYRLGAALHEELLADIPRADLEVTLRVLEQVKNTLTGLDDAAREPPRRKPRAKVARET